MARASILAIGTEITSGEITNRNAVWISENLQDLGFDVVAHLTVPDERALISAALRDRARESELVIVTGGLGPTTDDFTREVLAEWSGKALEFRESAWKKIVRRLEDRGIEVAPSNRQQAYFPLDSTTLENLEGTADGFRFTYQGEASHSTEVLVLPGPPREGKYLWERFVDTWIKETFPPEVPTDLERWHCLGISESSLGEIVERAVEGFGVKTGYRASVPYVEVKVWIPKNLTRELRLGLLSNLNAALAPYSVARGDETLTGKFENALLALPAEDRITVLDLGSAGRLSEKIIGILRGENAKPLRAKIEILIRMPTAASSVVTADEFPESDEWFFVLLPNGEAVVAGPRGKHIRTLPNPYPNPAMADRLGGYRSEMAMKVWTEILNSLSEPS
jgi:nicotinamide-nucleotide amidase